MILHLFQNIARQFGPKNEKNGDGSFWGGGGCPVCMSLTRKSPIYIYLCSDVYIYIYTSVIVGEDTQEASNKIDSNIQGLKKNGREIKPL